MGLEGSKRENSQVSFAMSPYFFFVMMEWHLSLTAHCVRRHGVRNSLLLAPMPTASTAQILGNNESFEAYTSNIYTRRVLSGEFQVSGLENAHNCCT